MTKFAIGGTVLSLVCHQMQQQTPTICVSCPVPEGLGSRRSKSIAGGTGSLRLSPSCSAGKSDLQDSGSQLPEGNIDSCRLTQHAMVLGPSDVVDPDSPAPSSVARPSNSTIQGEPSQRSPEPEPPHLAPRSRPYK